MTRMVLLGAKPLSVRVARFLHQHSDFELGAVVTTPKEDGVENRETLESYARTNGVPVVKFADLVRPERGYGISIGFPHILNRQALGLFERGVLNLHFGELPYYRGTGTPSYAILNREPVFGVSLHQMDEGIDTGPVFCVTTFAIPRLATAANVTALCEEVGYSLFCGAIAPICAGALTATPQDELLKRHGSNRPPRLYRSSNLGKLLPLNLQMVCPDLLVHLRALALPNRGLTVHGADGAVIDLGQEQIVELIQRVVLALSEEVER
jgi:methionyl-tRNA formyltransferase